MMMVKWMDLLSEKRSGQLEEQLCGANDDDRKRIW
jgi:hypothetical protein